MTPTLTLLIPTLGRPELRRALDSAMPQLLPGDEIIVIGDLRLGPLPDTEALCASYGAQVRYAGHDGGRPSWGHDQLNHGFTLARGEYLHASDDDDVWCPGSLAVMREAIIAHPGRVFLFRFRSYLGGRVYWLRPGLLAQATIGGHCLLQPNVPGQVGRMGPHYEGDHSWIIDTLARHEDPPIWVDHIVCEQRPPAQEIAA